MAKNQTKVEKAYQLIDLFHTAFESGKPSDKFINLTNKIVTGLKDSESGTVQGVFLDEAVDFLPHLLDNKHDGVFGKFVDTLFEVSKSPTVQLGRPVARGNSADTEFYEACASGNLALTALGGVALKILKSHPEEAVDIKVRLSQVFHPDEEPTKAKARIVKRLRL